MTPRKQPGEKKKTGRPPNPEPDPKIAQAICDNLELGMPITLAAEAEGIHRQTVYRWIEQFPEFALQVTRAKAAGAKNMVVRALKGEKGSAMSAWMLERRFREDYGPVNRLEHSGRDGKPVPVDVSFTVEYFEGLSDDELRRLVAAGQPAEERT